MRLPRLALMGLIRLYQLTLSPWLGRNCRFVPTCSNYALEAVERYGVFRGGCLAAMRLLRCHPWGSSGYDPVPKRFRWRCWCRDCSESDDSGGGSLR